MENSHQQKKHQAVGKKHNVNPARIEINKKYLGIKIYKNLTWNQHANNLKQNAYIAIR